MPFYAYEVALEVARLLVPIVEELKPRSRDLADQLERASTSVVLNVAEGNRRRGGDRNRFFSIAAGSASEVAAALDIAKIWNCSLDTTAVAAALHRERGLLWGLLHPRAALVTPSSSDEVLCHSSVQSS